MKNRVVFGIVIWLLVVASASAGEPSANMQLLASVRVGRFGGCSGTVFTADQEYAYILSAGHCVRPDEKIIGQKVGICTVDGLIHQGEWIAKSEEVDLAIARFPREKMLALTGIADRPPLMDGTWTAVGFPGTRGPNLKMLGDASISTVSGLRRWSMPVLSGTFAGGDSGGGIFQGTNLIGVVTHRVRGNAVLEGAGHNQVVGFVASVPAVAATLGIRCDGEICRKCGRIHDVAERWKPEPNKPISLPERVPRDGTFPDKKTSEYIVELTKRIDAQDWLIAKLRQDVDELKAGGGARPDAPPPVPSNERGLTGPQGPKGDKGDIGLTGPQLSRNELLEVVKQVVVTDRDALRGPAGVPGLVIVEVRKPNGTRDEYHALNGGRVIVDVTEIVKPKTKGK